MKSDEPSGKDNTLPSLLAELRSPAQPAAMRDRVWQELEKSIAPSGGSSGSGGPEAGSAAATRKANASKQWRQALGALALLVTGFVAGVFVTTPDSAPAKVSAFVPRVAYAVNHLLPAPEPVVVQVLEGDNAVLKYREVMGATNPANADEGTIRKLFALSVGENSVHGSDSLENANIEIAQFFKPEEIVG